jgi:hypothetical protein
MVSIRNTVVIFSLVKEKSFDKKIDKAYKRDYSPGIT